MITGDPTISGFPSKERPNSEKDAKYILAWGRAILAKQRSLVMAGAMLDDNTGRVPNLYNNYMLTNEVRQFTRCLNDVARYKRVFALNSPEANNILTGRQMQWKTPMDQGPYFDRLRDILVNRDTDAVATVLDPQAKDAHIDGLLEMKAALVLSTDEAVRGASESMGIDVAPAANEPQDLTEFDLFQRMGSKPAVAATVELTMQAWRNLVDYQRAVRRPMADSLIDDNITIVVLWMNNMGIPIPMPVRYENCLIPWTSNNFQTMPTFAVRVFMTPSEIMAEMGDDCTPAVRRRLQKMGYRQSMQSVNMVSPLFGSGTILNPNINEDGIEVIKFWFMDYNTFDVAERKDDGTAMLADKSMDPSEYEFRRNQYDVVYQGCFLPNTSDGKDGEVDHDKELGSISWGCRMAYNAPRQRKEIWKTRIPVAIGTYDMNNMTCLSLGARMMAAYEPVIMASLEMKALILNIIPPMIIVKEEWLNNVTAHDGSGQAKRSDIIKAALQGGVLVVNTRNPDNPDDKGDDIKVGIQINDAFIPDFSRLSALIDYEMARFERIAGFNESNNGGTVDERTAVRNMNMMAKSQARALKPVTDCMDQLETDIYRIVYGMMQCSLVAGKEIDWIGPMIGEASARVARLTYDTDPGWMGIEVKAMSTEEERLELEEALSQAAVDGTITVDERLAIRGMRNTALASEILAVRREKREKTAQQNQMAAIQQQSQGQAQVVEMQAKANADKLRADIEARAAELEAKSEAKLREIEAKAKLDGDNAMQLAILQLEGKHNEQMAVMSQILAKLDHDRKVSEDANEAREEVAETAAKAEVESARIAAETSIAVAKENAQAAKSRPKSK